MSTFLHMKEGEGWGWLVGLGLVCYCRQGRDGGEGGCKGPGHDELMKLQRMKVHPDLD